MLPACAVDIKKLDGGKDRKEKTMKKKHGVFFGFAVLLIAAMFTLTGCGDNGDPTSPPDDELTGSVSIGGIAKYTHRIWTVTSSLGGTGTISYEWIRGTSTTIGTGVYYDITAADIGQTIKVKVSREEGGKTKTKTSATVSPVYHNIGDVGPAGGRVYYDDGSEDYWLLGVKRFIEIAPQLTADSLPWGLSGTESKPADNSVGSQLGNGKLWHDAAIAAGAGSGTAVKVCEDLTVILYNGELWERTFDDWFLPGLGELAKFQDYQEKNGDYATLTYDNTVPGLSGLYWTSYNATNTTAYFVGFVSDPDTYGSLEANRTEQNKVHAIRWF
jgi:hypothetical protein